LGKGKKVYGNWYMVVGNWYVEVLEYVLFIFKEEWRDGKVEGWKNGRGSPKTEVGGGKNGEMEKWKVGRLEDGRVERGRSGRMERLETNRKEFSVLTANVCVLLGNHEDTEKTEGHGGIGRGLTRIRRIDAPAYSAGRDFFAVAFQQPKLFEPLIKLIK